MNMWDFEDWVLAHWNKNGKPVSDNILYLSNALCGETGELANVVKKIVRDHDSIVYPDNREKLVLEAGDIIHYLIRFLQKNDIELEEVLDCNYDKIEDRYKEKVTGYSA